MQNAPHWAVERLLNFLNRARSVEDITQNPSLRDSPNSGESEGGYIIGETVAQRILDQKTQLSRRRYQTTDDVLSVAGLGKDKLQDLIHSFNTPADDFFLEQLFQPVGPLHENWEVTAYTHIAGSQAEYDLMVAGLDRLKVTAADLLPDEDARVKQLRAAYVATFGEAHPASYEFASWWYSFDQDNWFGFDSIRKVCESYLNYHSSPKEIIFGYFFLYNSRNSGFNEIRPSERIPFVINPAELKFTIWQVHLND